MRILGWMFLAYLVFGVLIVVALLVVPPIRGRLAARRLRRELPTTADDPRWVSR